MSPLRHRSQIVVDLLRRMRALHDTLSVAVELLHDKDQENDRVRSTNQHLREQIRQSRRTDADLRQRGDMPEGE